jgi:hypothetical protein
MRHEARMFLGEQSNAFDGFRVEFAAEAAYFAI